MMDEGYIKFTPHWKETQPYPDLVWNDLNTWRQKVYNQGLIGVYPDNIGYGNISQRLDQTQFVISGSTTGRIEQLDGQHYSKVIRVDLEENALWCEGPIVASSESMSHAVIYQALPSVNGVIHVHHLGFWEALLQKVPTTGSGIPYGSPGMAYSILDLIEHTALPEVKIFVMEGHREGVFVFGRDLAEADRILNHWLNKEGLNDSAIT